MKRRTLLLTMLGLPLAAAEEERIGMIAMTGAGGKIEVFDKAGGLGTKRLVAWKTAAAVSELGYEEEGLLVLERQAEWFRVKMLAGTAWIRLPKGAKFVGMGELLTETLTYLTKEWDGKLAKSAGGTMGPKLKTEVEPTIKVLGKQLVEGRLWIKAAVLDASPCEVASPKVLAGGWVPARVVWFYSRGC